MSDFEFVALTAGYGRPSPVDDVVFAPEHFARFVASSWAVPVRINHEGLITSQGVVESVGRACRFASVRAPAPGLAMLAQLDRGPLGWSLAEAIRDGIAGRRDPALSVSLAAIEDPDTPGAWWPVEVSITPCPADPCAAILAAGDDARRVWELLTGEPAPQRKATPW